MAAAWNTASAGSNIAFSGGNLTATATTTTFDSCIADTAAVGDVYWETTGTGTSHTGMGDSSAPGAALFCAGPHGIGWWRFDGTTIFFNNNSYLGIAAETYSGLTAHCIKQTGGVKRYWRRQLPAGNWNNSGTANPATNTGGIDLDALISGFGMGSTLYAAAAPYGSGDAVTANFAGPFSGTPPSGYSAYDASGGGATGTLTATEAKDTAALAGNVSSGTLAATEAKDTASLTGNVASVGTLAATDARDVAAFTGTVGSAITGTLSATEAADTATLTGAVATVGSLAATEANDVAAFTGSVSSVGNLAATDTKDAASFTASVGSAGSLAATEPKDTATFVGAVASVGALSGVEAPDVAGFVGALAVTGSLAATEAKDTASFIATSVTGTLVASETPDSAAFLGVVFRSPGVYPVDLTGGGSVTAGRLTSGGSVNSGSLTGGATVLANSLRGLS